MRVLVTGGAGFIGSNFIKLLLGGNLFCEVTCLDKLTYAGNLSNLQPIFKDPRFRFIGADICNQTIVSQAMADCDAVVHFAAETHVDNSITEPLQFVQTNVVGTYVLLQEAKNRPLKKFVYVSTDEVYGDMWPDFYADETFSIHASSPYSAAKAAAEQLVMAYVRTFNLPGVITRGSNTYGPNQYPEKLIPLFIRNLSRNHTVPIYGDGKQQRQWVHVDDHCQGIFRVLVYGKVGEVYNIGGFDVVSNLLIAKMIAEMMGKDESLFRFVEDRPGHDRRYAMSCRKIAKELGFVPEISLQKGLAQTIAAKSVWEEFRRELR